MELILGLSITAAFWITASIVVIKSNNRLKAARQPRNSAKVRRFSPGVEQALCVDFDMINPAVPAV